MDFLEHLILKYFSEWLIYAGGGASHGGYCGPLVDFPVNHGQGSAAYTGSGLWDSGAWGIFGNYGLGKMKCDTLLRLIKCCESICLDLKRLEVPKAKSIKIVFN